MERGEIHLVNLSPTEGHEQRGQRPVLVLTRAEFNRLGTPLVCPITQGGAFARSAGFAVPLAGSGTRTQGVVLCHQLRTLDMEARGSRLLERAPTALVDEVLARVATLLD